MHDATKRRGAARVVVLGALALAVAGLLFALLYRPFPSDRTPEGAYMRIARAVGEDDPRGFFAYLETEAQWACFTIHRTRKQAADRVRASYPEPERSRLLAKYEPLAVGEGGAAAFAAIYEQRGWARRLRKDLSGVDHVEVSGERATVVTAQGTRWPFRLRDNGIWGLTVFTAELATEARKATRDLEIVTATAADYDRVKAR